MRLYLLPRLLAFPTFLAYVGVRIANPEISILGDLVLFNLVALLASISALFATTSAGSTRIPIALAILAWTCGSTVSSWNAMIGDGLPAWTSDLGYLLFYPLLFFGLVSSLKEPQRSNRLQLLDSLIIALGISSLLSIIALSMTNSELGTSDYEMILKNFYPIADVLLVATVLVIIIRSGLDTRNLIMLLALGLFAFVDVLFLIQSSDGSYRFGSIIDSGWLIAVILLAEGQWQRTSERIKKSSHPLFATVLAAVTSGLVIAIEVLLPERLPSGAMIPAFATLTLAFVRMSLALMEAQSLNDVALLATTDELTGLANRRRFVADLADTKIGDFVILIDLNEFKPINDSFGHETGDELLRQVALRLSRTFERDWTFARLGGDEFGLLVRGGGSKEEVANSIAASFSYPFRLPSAGEVSISASIGVAEEDGGGEILRRADLAMYSAKRSGRTVVFWSRMAPDASNLSPLTDRR